MKLHDLQDFRTWGADTRGWRPTTRHTYATKLVRADTWLLANRNVALPRASTDSLQAWLVTLPRTASTRNGHRNALAAYYAYLRDRRRRRDDPSIGLPRLREHRTVPRALTTAEVEHLLTIARAHSPKWGVALTMLAYTGVRASEACHVQWADLQGPWMTVTGKGGHQRTVPIHEDLRGALSVWRGQCDSPEWVLPGRWPGSRLTYQGLYYGFAAVADAAGLPAHPHLLRSTFATAMLDGGVDVRTVQRLLGHANLATTSRYLAARDALAVDAVSTLPWAKIAA